MSDSAASSDITTDFFASAAALVDSASTVDQYYGDNIYAAMLDGVSSSDSFVVSQVGYATAAGTNLNAMFIRLLQAAIDHMTLPPGIQRTQVTIRMPQAGWTAMPFIVVNLDTVREVATNIGEDVENPTEANIWSLFSHARYCWRVTIMSQDVDERDFYRDSLLAVFQVLKATVFQPMGFAVSQSFQAVSYPSAQEWDGHIPGFYGADLLLELTGVFPTTVKTNYPVILDITPIPAFDPNRFEIIL